MQSITLRICDNRLHQAKTFIFEVFQVYNMEAVELGFEKSLYRVQNFS